MIGELGSCTESTERALRLPDQWNLIHTKPQREELAAASLAQLGADVLYPRIQAGTKRAAFFPSYLFVRIPEPCFWHSLRAPGVGNIVRLGSAPAIVDQVVIDALRARMGLDGVIALEQIKSGDHVRVVDGPFAGFSAVFCAVKSWERCEILLKSLHHDRTLKVEVSRCDIQSNNY